MNSRVRFSVCVAVLTSAATLYWDAGEAAAQGYNGHVTSQSQRKTGGLLGRFFSKRKSQPEQPPAAAPSTGAASQQYQAQQYQAQQYQAQQQAAYQPQPQYAAPQQYPAQQVQAQQYSQQQQPAPQYSRPAAPRRSKIQELLEARYRAEGREMPPLTMQQLAVQQQMEMQQMMPQVQQPQHAQQTQQAYQQPYQQAQQPQQAPQQFQPQYAAGQPSAGHAAYGQSRPVTSPAAGGYAAQQHQQPSSAANEEKPRRSGFRAFLSRINPFHKDKDEEPQTASQSLPSASGHYPPQQHYAQQPMRQQPGYPPQYMQPHRGQQVAQPRRTQSPVAPQIATTPPGYRTPYNAAARSQYGQPAANDTLVEPRPFPGVPNVAREEQNVVAQPQSEPTINFSYNEPQQTIEEDLPVLAEMPAAEEPIEEEDDIDLFDDEPLPNLADVNVAPEAAPTTDDGFRPTEQPQFEEPIIANEESADLPADEPQVAADDSESPYSGLTLDEEAAELPKLQPVPMRNNYINLEHLNAEVDSEALRREKRRLLLLSRPEKAGLKGFCPVTLKNDRDLVDARPEFQVEFESKVYQLSSEEAKQEFERAPQEYAPAKGGIDMVKYTLGAGEVEGTLEFAAWYRDRLYLFSSAVTYDAFMRNPGKFAAPAEAVTAEEPAFDDAADETE